MARAEGPRPSVCASIPGWRAYDSYPHRSPLATADYLAPRVAGKSFCELGTRHGDIASCLLPHARNVSVLEYRPEYCSVLRRRGLRVVCESIYDVAASSAARFPVADIYFFWVPHTTVERWIRLLLNASRHFPRPATVFVQLDGTNRVEVPHVERLARRYSATQVVQVFHDEGNRGVPLVGDGECVRAHRKDALCKQPRRGMMNLLRLETTTALRAWDARSTAAAAEEKKKKEDGA